MYGQIVAMLWEPLPKAFGYGDPYPQDILKSRKGFIFYHGSIHGHSNRSLCMACSSHLNRSKPERFSQKCCLAIAFIAWPLASHFPLIDSISEMSHGDSPSITTSSEPTVHTYKPVEYISHSNHDTQKCKSKCNEIALHTDQEGCYQKTEDSTWWLGCGEKGTVIYCLWEC